MAKKVVKMSFQKQAPSEFLKQIIGKPVVVKLNSGVDYRGKHANKPWSDGAVFGVGFNKNFLRLGVLACLDGYMNIALEQTEEYVNGQLKNKYGDAFIRGNNGMTGVMTGIYICVLFFPLVLYISTRRR